MRLLRIIGVLGLVALVLWIAVYIWQHPNGTKQFEYAFGIPPPTGVDSLVAYRRYVGGPGDTFVLLRFSANRKAIDEAVAFRPLERDLHVVGDRLKLNNDVRQFWRSIFGRYADYGGSMWRAPSELIAPEVYEWRGAHAQVTLVKLLWDAHTGGAYVLFTIG